MLTSYRTIQDQKVYISLSLKKEMQTITINYLAVLLSAISAMVIGGLWYSPLVFGNVWMKLANITEKQIKEAKKKGMTKSYILMFFSTVVMSYVLAHFVKYMQITTVGNALKLAVWIWLGFITTILISSVLWEGKPVKLYFLNISHYLITLIVMTIILTFLV